MKNLILTWKNISALDLLKKNYRQFLNLWLIFIISILITFAICVLAKFNIEAFFKDFFAANQNMGESEINNTSMISTIVVGLLPHGMIEFSVFIIATIVAISINKWIRRTIRNLFRSSKKDNVSFVQMIVATCKYAIYIIIPGTLLASFIEIFITGNLVKIF